MPNAPYRIKSISEVYRLAGLGKPSHPLIGVIDLAGVSNESGMVSVIFDLYVVSLKRGCDKLLYGQQVYDFDEGLMGFLSPGQLLRHEDTGKPENLEGWMLFVHPDFLWNTALASKIRKYDYFGYASNEALFLSDKEEAIVNSIVENIRSEYKSNLDKFSQDVIIAHLETLFAYAQRFYERQFITRKISNHQILAKLENELSDYLNAEELLSKGLPTVKYLASKLNLSPKYLSSLLKQLTGQTTQQIIHEKLIEKAKEKLSTTDLTISEIAYGLGFEHSQSFSKIFKSKTKLSPLEFRQSFT